MFPAACSSVHQKKPTRCISHLPPKPPAFALLKTFLLCSIANTTSCCAPEKRRLSFRSSERKRILELASLQLRKQRVYSFRESMAQNNLHISEITPGTQAWTCKIQIVDICGPGESKEKKTKYLNLIAQDEQEAQVKAIIYGDDIPRYQDRISLYCTYYVTTAHVQPASLKYEKSLHAFEWVLDKRTIIDPVAKDDVDALPLPTKLNLTSFPNIKQQVLETATDVSKLEFDILAIVANCFPPRYVTSLNKRLQELIVMDMFKQTFILTIWDEDIIRNEGEKLLQQFQEYPIILARRLGGSKYNGASLTTKFCTTIQIDPPYPQRQQLQAWVTENKEILTSFTLRSTSNSGSLISVPVDEEVVSIANIDSQQDGHTFSIEAKLTLPTDVQRFYVLVCSNCGQEVRYPNIREIHCMNCNQQSMLIPRCRFDVNLRDNTASTSGMIMDQEGERLLSLTAQQIYERASTLINCAAMEDVQANFSNKLFRIRAKKSFVRTHTATTKLYIQSCVEKKSTAHSLPPLTTFNTPEGSKRKQKMESGQVTEGNESSLKMKQKLELPTPEKPN